MKCLRFFPGEGYLLLHTAVLVGWVILFVHAFWFDYFVGGRGAQDVILMFSKMVLRVNN